MVHPKTIIAALIISAQSVFGFTFTWPPGVSNAGPYTLKSGVYSLIALTPNTNEASENDLATHKYHHHTRIFVSDGVIYLAFSSGRTNESDGGAQSALMVSTNGGTNWSSPIQVVPSQSAWSNSPGAYLVGSRMSYPRNFSTLNGTNYLVCAVDNIVTGGYFSGAALLARAVFPDSTVGPLFRISTNTYAAIDGKDAVDYNSSLGPSLFSESNLHGTWGGSYPAPDGNPQSPWIGWLIQDPKIWTEPNTFSFNGSTTNLLRIWRQTSDSGAQATNLSYLHVQQSTNSGANWDGPTWTSVPNNPSEICGLRFSNGAFGLIGNPLRYSAGSVNRDPLYLAIASPDGTVTNVSSIVQGVSGTPIYPSNSKGGGAQYPGVFEYGGMVYVSYSLRKEEVGFSKFQSPGNLSGFGIQFLNINTLFIGP